MNSEESGKIPLISIISLNWNTIEVTSDFLRSINAHCSYPNLEIIIVDNASDVDPTDHFLSIRPDLRIIRNSSNMGFTGGNNVGIKEAKGDYFFIVNNDTEFTPGLLEGLMEVFEHFADAAAHVRVSLGRRAGAERVEMIYQVVTGVLSLLFR